MATKIINRELVCDRCGCSMSILQRFCPQCGEGMWNIKDKTQVKARAEYFKRLKLNY